MIFSFLLLTSLLVPTAQLADPCGCEDKPQVRILAVVNGVKIIKQELGSDTQNRVSLLQDQVIKARNAELDLQINRILLEAEAKRRGVTAAKLLELEVSAKVTEPTEDEAKAFYNQRQERLQGDFKTVKADIITLLKNEREKTEAARFAYLLRGTAVISILAENVTPPASEQELNRVFAKVNGQNITSRDIEQSLAPLIYRVQEQVYAARKEDLDLKINDMLLEQEAKRQNTTPDTILARAVRAKLPVITDQEAKTFYEENKARMRDDFEKVKLVILQYLLDREQKKLSEAFAAELRRNAAVQIYLTPPEPLKRP
jgi:hypothetical protein